MANELVLIDLSSIAHPAWHTHQSDPDSNKTSQVIIARVHALANGHQHVAVCCDSGKSFRKDLSESYKANRPDRDAALHHQIAVAREQLEADGFPLWAVKMFEADDLIASATVKALASTDLDVLIVSADKDLLQLVGPRVRAMSTATGAVLGHDEVVAKFGVLPSQMRDFLTLVGDTSDNVKGAKNIGTVKAAALLKQFPSLDHLYADLDEVGAEALGIPPATAKALRDFKASLPTTRALITLRDDVPIPFEQVLAERVSKAAQFEDEQNMDTQDSAPPAATETLPVVAVPDAGPASASAALAVRQPEAQEPPAPAPAQWEMQLEPRSMRDAKVLATDMHASRLFSAYGTPAAILSTVMAGRELGMQAMASLRAFHLVEGRPTLAADLIRALVINSGKAKYFRCTERTATRATFVTQRDDDPPISLTYTVEEGRQAFAGDQSKWEKSGWGRNSADMCVARAGSKLARLVYPDVIHGLYSMEEFD